MSRLNIVMPDTSTLGDDLDFSIFENYGSVTKYSKTASNEICERISGADIIIVNKLKLNAENLSAAKKLKLICITATGYDNIDVEYCKSQGIAVCNVTGYSTDSVAQVTMAVALSLVNKLQSFDSYVKTGRYSKSGVANKVVPTFHEMQGMTWGIVGLGAIGKRVANAATALGCEVLAYKRTYDEEFDCVSIEELCRRSDIISIHTPLNSGTMNLISGELIAKMKKNAIVVNMARGAVVDEAALAEALEEERIGGLAVDVYTYEPVLENSPYMRLAKKDNVIFTPHMAWGAYEARVRCMEEIAKNINAFLCGEIRNRVDN